LKYSNLGIITHTETGTNNIQQGTAYCAQHLTPGTYIATANFGMSSGTINGYFGGSLSVGGKGLKNAYLYVSDTYAFLDMTALFTITEDSTIKVTPVRSFTKGKIMLDVMRIK